MVNTSAKVQAMPLLVSAGVGLRCCTEVELRHKWLRAVADLVPGI